MTDDIVNYCEYDHCTRPAVDIMVPMNPLMAGFIAPNGRYACLEHALEMVIPI